MKIKLLLLTVFFGFSAVFANPSAKKRILIYTKNGKGYVHKNIASSVEAWKKIGEENNLIVDVSDDPAVMNTENLSKYSCLIFSNTCNAIFDTEQQKQAFVDYIHSGGAFVGIHSASDSEKSWPWYATMVGGRFKRHPAFQSFEIKVIDKNHPATSMLGETWKKEDECYYMNEFNPNIHILLAADMRTVNDKEKEVYPGRTFGDYLPLAWCHEFEGGRVFYTALGHDSKDYTNSVYLEHITGGLLWALGTNSKKSNSKRK
ncbi:ThuA domain-containing protein [Flavobacterium eburneipallidum]|uniref:ThuA domain-containing protein n=1 Tax=Flavobacterium eburneipallidum TaxID=3003263 RepID=UPI0022AC0F79|nr:ThuA domain-containing protein [Flavobacterium eburneipallidum]